MKPTNFHLTIAITAHDDEWGGDDGVNIFSGQFRCAHTEMIGEVLAEMLEANESGLLVAWGVRERFATMPSEMENDPEQEAAFATLFGAAA